MNFLPLPHQGIPTNPRILDSAAHISAVGMVTDTRIETTIAEEVIETAWRGPAESRSPYPTSHRTMPLLEISVGKSEVRN
ncbi:hypothetical protein PGTUg99_001716 [Puccinia graminis f. sp. tritici]|uniref:Uncharacterized protein n=1 Tax=Puccinia graminis f. sp. tritici TaxID=56615 RepID=A0A5B0S9H7_PUCGR|nr:hypothetical protein PGTUg99_001716 [Puccinia graminis f. sp. tritici]